MRKTLTIGRSALMFFQRAFQALVSLVTIGFIAHFLSPEEQGWYYAFLSLASLYALADLGLSVALVPYFARTFASTNLKAHKILEGPNRNILAEQLKQSFGWYAAVGLLYVLILLPFGVWFFGRLQADGPHPNWILPWVAIVIAFACQLLLLPLIAFIEAAGEIVSLSLMRLLQLFLGGCVSWLLLYNNQGLWAAFVVALSGVVIPLAWIGIKWPQVLRLLKNQPRIQFSFKIGINGVQWRIAVSWICAYLSSQIYSLILAQVDGPVISGQFALSMALVNMVGILGLSSMASKVAFVVHDAANNDMQNFKEKFKRDLIFFLSFYCLGVLSVLIAYWLIKDHTYVTRILPLWQIISLMVFIFIVNLMNLFAMYIRAYLREPFMRVNVISTLLTVPLACLGALYFSSAGIVLSLMGVAVCVMLPLAIIVWRVEIDKALCLAVLEENCDL